MVYMIGSNFTLYLLVLILSFILNWAVSLPLIHFFCTGIDY